ncbi:hypothetical protein EXIGLDRAFT_323260 [Exidia glandulosa HHB12029]|uniref:Uncharacterized protein n=1 Tax=Exidia glandulosa HHB12029 TaxID=1314781 RepID=A0A165CW91_EXIGL|nr:hypothetical protein EXIGLDRAFT_323260 [Exidia glandulosa HHB12029]
MESYRSFNPALEDAFVREYAVEHIKSTHRVGNCRRIGWCWQLRLSLGKRCRTATLVL